MATHKAQNASLEHPAQEPDEPTPDEPTPEPEPAITDYEVMETWVPENIPLTMVPAHWQPAVALARAARRSDAGDHERKAATAAIKELFPDAPDGDIADLLDVQADIWPPGTESPESVVVPDAGGVS
jgi:hypothetical protein